MNIDVVYIQDLSSEIHNILKNNQPGSLPVECKNFLLRGIAKQGAYKVSGICFVNLFNLELKTYFLKKSWRKLFTLMNQITYFMVITGILMINMLKLLSGVSIC